MSYSFIPSIRRRRFLGAVTAVIVLPACGGGQASSEGDAPVQPGASPISSNPLSLHNISASTLYIAHRGSAALFPEETYVAYDNSIKFGEIALECDVRSLADGTLGVMHDSTVDRTTNGRGLINTLTKNDWEKLSVDANIWHGSNYGNDLTAPFFSDWVARYKDRAALIIEDKDLVSTPRMVSVLDSSGISKDQVLIQSFSLDTLITALKSGYQTCFLHNGPPDPSSAVKAGVQWTGIDASSSNSDLRKWVSSGIKVIIFTVNRRYFRDAKLLLGITGFFSDDPFYLRANTPLHTTDQFHLQTWAPGMLGSNGDLDLRSRGKFFPDAYWGYDINSNGYLGCLHGYLCPLKGSSTPTTYTIDFSITFDNALENDSTRWASVCISTDDSPFMDSASDKTMGYHILLRKNGTIQIYKKSPGSVAVLLAASGSPNVPNAQKVRYRVSVNGDNISAIRLQEGGAEYKASVDDTSYRGGYLHFGRNGLACRFSEIFVN